MKKIWEKRQTREGGIFILLIGLVMIRFLAAKDDFSYDYFAYIHNLRIIADNRLGEVFSSEWLLFPYVNIPGGAAFELGFVVVAKVFLLVFVEPRIAYAAMAATSVGIRVYVMRRLGAHWLWIIVVGIYAITLLEANAIRVGMAVSLVIYGLYRLHEKRPLSALLIIGFSMFMHLQALFFTFPLAFVWSLRKYIDRSRTRLIIVLLMLSLGTFLLLNSNVLTGNIKMTEYANRNSISAGLSFTSISAIIFTLVALTSPRRTVRYEHGRLIWISIVLAIIPSLIIFVTVTNIAAIGGRAWQFSFVILTSFIFTKWAGAEKRLNSTLILGTLAAISTLNVTLRFPLSNFFNFVLRNIEF